MSESKAALWIALLTTFAGVVASWVTLREQTAIHERHITKLQSDVQKIQEDDRLSERLRALELSVTGLTNQVAYLRDELLEMKEARRR